jgi:CDP-glucose 4,6-dehydratase
MTDSFWKGRRVFVTGHTGFKGGWLCLWLQQMGAEVHGFAFKPPTDPNIYSVARVGEGMATSTIADIVDRAALGAAIAAARPEIVLHLAAQSLVRASYDDPVGTYATNVMGILHLLEAVRAMSGIKAFVNVTSDKCYENREWVWPYREDEAMGGHDPYSSSKGCSEILTASYRRSYFEKVGPALASARAGNVIGGGDWARDRLIPDILAAFGDGRPVKIRNPEAVRPWQHVLEPVSGYLLLARLLFEYQREFAEGWNFGPEESDARPVRWIVERLAAQAGGRWSYEQQDHAHEAHNLRLDSSKARMRLGWRPRWCLVKALEKTVAWDAAWRQGEDIRAVSLAQIADYAQGPNA